MVINTYEKSFKSLAGARKMENGQPFKEALFRLHKGGGEGGQTGAFVV